MFSQPSPPRFPVAVTVDQAWINLPIQPPMPRRVARRAHHNRSTFPSPYYTFDVCTVRCTLHELYMSSHAHEQQPQATSRLSR